MTTILVGTFFLAVIAMRVQRHVGLEKWQVSLILIGLAIILYLVNGFLIQYFIKRRAPKLASNEEIIPGMQAWELTADLGIVPKWVSILGLLSISAIVTAVLPWVVALLK